MDIAVEQINQNEGERREKEEKKDTDGNTTKRRKIREVRRTWSKKGEVEAKGEEVISVMEAMRK